MATIETELPRSTFAAGEVPPTLRARADLARHLTGVARLENMAVLFEGGLTRCPGTQFVAELKAMDEKGELGPFRFAPGDAYHLVFNGGFMRLVYDGGIVESAPGVPFELAVPWAEADLPHLRLARAGNVLYAVCNGYAPRKLTRLAHTNWTIEVLETQYGPFAPMNLDPTKKIGISAVAGSVTVSTGFNLFTAAHVGAVWGIEETDRSHVPLWIANETIALPFANVSYSGSTNIGDFASMANAYDGNAATSATFLHVSGQSHHIGKKFAAPTAIARARVALTCYNLIGSVAVNLQLRAKAGSAPSGLFDGVLLGEASPLIPGGAAQFAVSVDLVSNNSGTSFDYVWIVTRHDLYNSFNGAPLNIGVHFWEINFQNYSSGSAVLRRYQGNVYRAVSAGNSGVNPPTHDDGEVLSGPGGVTWAFAYGPRTYFRVTAVTDAQTATADVIGELPESVRLRGTYRWYPPAWTSEAGWPDLVVTMDRSLVFFRNDEFWKTRPNTDANFGVNDDLDNPDTAINSRITSNAGLVVQMRWAMASGIMVAGTVDGEWMLRAPQAFEPWSGNNIRAVPDSDEGSAAHVPVPVDGGVAFIGKARDRLHWLKFNSFTEKLEPEEITRGARHILAGAAVQLAWQKDPNRVIWVRCADGSLVGCTFFLKEKVIGFFRRPFVNGFVESVSAVPSADQAADVVELIVRRTINGGTKRYIERMRPFFKPQNPDAPTASGAWFLDCAIAYAGAPATTLGGLSHLENEWVGVFADGSMHPKRQVAGGQIALERAVSSAVIGLPTYWTVESLPAEGALRDVKGAKKTATHLALDLLYAAAGRAIVNGGPPENLTVTGAMDYGAPLRLKTGPQLVPVSSPHAEELVWRLEGGGFGDALPFTLLGVTPLADVEAE